MRFRKPDTIPLIFIVCAFSLLMGLGIWQTQRLAWKQGVLASIEKVQGMPTLGTLPQDVSNLDYRNVALTGTFIYDKTMHLVGHPQDAGMGFYLLTPFQLEDDGRIILVNRGFSPPDLESKPEGLQTVTGIIRPVRIKRLFSPDNRPDKNVWFFEDFPAMSAYTGLAFTPIMVEAVGKAEKNVYPAPSDGIIFLRNDHLIYAITWFSLAIIALVMFGFYHRVPPVKTQE